MNLSLWLNQRRCAHVWRRCTRETGRNPDPLWRERQWGCVLCGKRRWLQLDEWLISAETPDTIHTRTLTYEQVTGDMGGRRVNHAT